MCDPVPSRPRVGWRRWLRCSVDVLGCHTACAAGHPFACADYTQGKVFLVDAGGRVEWEHSAPSCDEVWALKNGNLLFTTGHGVKEVTRGRAVVFQDESKSEIYACQRLANDETFIAECNAGRLLEVAPSGVVTHAVRLLPEGLAEGPYLLAHDADQVVREYDHEGRVLLSLPAAGGPHSVVRPSDGRTSVACGDLVPDGARVFEADPQAKTYGRCAPGRGHPGQAGGLEPQRP